MNWCQKAKESIRNSHYPQVRAFVIHNKLDPTKTKPHVLQRQIYNANEIYKKAVKNKRTI